RARPLPGHHAGRTGLASAKFVDLGCVARGPQEPRLLSAEACDTGSQSLLSHKEVPRWASEKNQEPDQLLFRQRTFVRREQLMNLECLDQVCAGSGRPFWEEEREQSPWYPRLGAEGGGESGDQGGWTGERATGQCSVLARGGRVTRRHSWEAGRRQGQALAAPGGAGARP
ncbi:unnamed protein product, partial [Gulo gulo]